MLLDEFIPPRTRHTFFLGDSYDFDTSRTAPLTDLPYIGTVVACEKDRKIYTGFAQCSPKDHYNKRIGRNIALERLKTGGGPSCAVPFIKFRPDGSKERIDVIGNAVKSIIAQAKFLNAQTSHAEAVR